jgi:hypothetical protein
VSLTLFHQGRIFCTDAFKSYNKYMGNVPPQ